ncbi:MULTISPECIES: PadR family transcriptional regulator [unclassified Brachybacterium]|uniref:PadR family transcriptional regulator n=1 Tax=unclassified Brachybacterium TaxID=2623841 RepID=UPI000C8072E4|nr:MULTISPECIES: PadR family transcriptional regulator [unclassified Brachybacterium]PMC74970.1 PadR family transcriptional regulator [Brachybacterium sp. UMB0905]
MALHHALLALLSVGPATTYQLRRAFDDATGQVKPLNIGQASSTLSRLERDGRIVRTEPSAPDATAGLWHLTEAGREELSLWWMSAVERTQPDRQELVMKFAVAVAVPGVDVTALVQTQRDATLSALHEATRVRRQVDPADLPAALVLDHHLVTLEAELRWLDDIEVMLERAAARRPASSVRPAETSAEQRSGARR